MSQLRRRGLCRKRCRAQGSGDDDHRDGETAQHLVRGRAEEDGPASGQPTGADEDDFAVIPGEFVDGRFDGSAIGDIDHDLCGVVDGLGGTQEQILRMSTGRLGALFGSGAGVEADERDQPQRHVVPDRGLDGDVEGHLGAGTSAQGAGEAGEAAGRQVSGGGQSDRHRGGVEERIGHGTDGEAPQRAVTGRADDDEIAGTCGGDVDEACCHGIGEMDRGRRADGFRNEVVRFGKALLGLVEAELLVLPFGFRRCLLRRGSAEDMDEVEFDGVGRQCRLSQVRASETASRPRLSMVMPTT